MSSTKFEDSCIECIDNIQKILDIKYNVFVIYFLADNISEYYNKLNDSQLCSLFGIYEGLNLLLIKNGYYIEYAIKLYVENKFKSCDNLIKYIIKQESLAYQVGGYSLKHRNFYKDLTIKLGINKDNN